MPSSTSAADLLLAVAEPTRLRIVNCLAAAPLFVSDLQAVLDRLAPQEPDGSRFWQPATGDPIRVFGPNERSERPDDASTFIDVAERCGVGVDERGAGPAVRRRCGQSRVECLLDVVQPGVVAAGERQDVGTGAAGRRDSGIADQQDRGLRGALSDAGEHRLDVYASAVDRGFQRIGAVHCEVFLAGTAGRIRFP